MNDPTFTAMKRNDPEVVEAHAKAAATIPDFIAAVQGGGSRKYLAKLRFRDPDISEKLGEDRFFYLWLHEVAYHPDEKLLSGEFFEVPEGFEKWHPVGSRLGFEAEDVFDWMILDNGLLRGGFTIRVHRSRLPKDQRAAHDEFIGATSYDPPEQ